jgi:hypothetical protein
MDDLATGSYISGGGEYHRPLHPSATILQVCNPFGGMCFFVADSSRMLCRIREPAATYSHVRFLPFLPLLHRGSFDV